MANKATTRRTDVHRARLVMVLLLLGLLAGCKLTIKVPVGGEVSSDGGIVCSAGQQCEIDISTTTFDHVFTASAAAGYAFTGWIDGEYFLCSGSLEDCRVRSNIFAGIPFLEALLDGDLEVILAPHFDRVEGLDPPSFQSAFGPGTQVQEDGTGWFGDIVGGDYTVAWPNHWVDDLEGGTPFNEFRLYFEGGTQDQRIVERVEEPPGSGNWLLRFRIEEPNVVELDEDAIACNGLSHIDAAGEPVPEERKARIQTVLRDTPGLSRVEYRVRVRLGPGFAAFVDSPSPVRWMTLAEFWNDLPEPLGSPNPKHGFRISLAALKDEAVSGAPFSWYVHAQTQSTTTAGKWNTLWKSTDDHEPVSVPTDGSWVELRVALLEGDAGTGRTLITVTDASGWTQTIVDKIGWTRHPLGAADGFEALNPLKLYTNGPFVCGLKAQAGLPLSVDWDDFAVGGEIGP